MPIWARLVTAVGALRVSLALALYLSGQVEATGSPLPLWSYALISASLLTVGGALLVGNSKDVRASWLGASLVVLASPMTARLMSPELGAIALWINQLHPDAFLPVFLWRFLIEFPSSLREPWRRIAAAVAVAATVFGVAAFLVNVSVAAWPLADGEAWRRLLVARGGRGSLYWPAVFLPSAVMFIGLLARLATSVGADRFRLRVFIGGLAAGLLPLLIEVTIEESWPPFAKLVHTPAVEPWVGFVLFTPLALVPFLTAYSVVYDRIVEMRVIVRAALQYLLARYMVLAVTMVPFVALGFYLVRHRSEPLVALMVGPRPLFLVGAIVAGFTAMRARDRWLEALDRRFFREHYDAQLLVTRVIGSEFVDQTLAEIAERLSAEVDRTLHSRADLFVADDGNEVLRDPRRQCPSLDARSTLVALAMADHRPMEINLDPGSALERLTPAEKAWISSGEYRVLIALRTRLGECGGLLALGQKRSELPYSESDQQSLAALAAPIAVAIENERLRQAPEPATERAARECVSCSRLLAPEVTSCACGGAVAEASAPHVLRGVFRFDRRIGAGGMGVVYLAHDLNLGREVAIKTLPRVTGDLVSRLRREAKAMASIEDPNLAVVYGIETWRGIPFLVEEYLAGGTLANRLHIGPMSIAEVLDLGITLSGVLGRLHSADIVHCDIKPSNIGYSRNGVAKLLDFGLAHLLRGTGPDPSPTQTISHSTNLASAIFTDRGVMGTPAYMSPEALSAAQPSPAFDIWGLCVVLYEAIACRRPFQGANVSEVTARIRATAFDDLRNVRAGIGDELATFFTRAFSSDPTLRPSDAASLSAELRALRSAL